MIATPRSESLRLFAFFLGGEFPGALLELHDVQFVAARSLSAAYPILRRNWWGTPGSLHIDAYTVLSCVDGYKIRLVEKRDHSPTGPSLFFVNTGGYVRGEFGEHHEYSFHVGVSKRAIWEKLRVIHANRMQAIHVDNFDEIDGIIHVDSLIQSERFDLAVDLIEGAHACRDRSPEIKNRYIRL